MANDFWYQTGAGTQLLYKNEGATVLTDCAAINALTDTSASNNVCVLPGFKPPSLPHLSADAGVLGLGINTGTGAPSNDYDPRPMLGRDSAPTRCPEQP